MKKMLISGLAVAFGLMLQASIETSSSATSEVFRISIKHDGIRASAGAETLRYSPLWDGGSNATAKVALKQGDVVLSEDLTTEGDYAWSVSRNGTYNLAHTTYTNGAVAKALNATFVVTGLPDPFPSGSVTATGYNGKYDGNGHGITVTTTDIANPSITYSRTAAGPYTVVNPLFTNVCNETVWYVVAASGYITETNSAMVVISNGDIGGGGGEEPGTGELPPGGVSKFDAIAMYDGDGHTIDTNALVTAFKGCIVGAFEIRFGRAGSMNPPSGDFIEVALPVWTNVVATSLWYKVTSPNYNDFVHEAKVTITNRAIALASVASIADQEYTGTAIQPVPTVTDQRTLIGGTSPTDIIATDDYTVSYADNVNVGAAKVILTGMNNYAGVVTNTFQIVPAVIPPGPGGAVTVTGYTNAYDGVAHGVVVTVTGLKTMPSVQYRSSPTAEWQSASPTYIDVCDTQVWWKVSAPNYSDATGTIGVLIAQAENAWTTEPAIAGWTYGDSANTPVGAARFGEVVFAYSPTPVGAAGDYVMTASVAGTANYTGLSSNVAFTVALRSVVPGGADDPERADPAKPLPSGAVSKFDFTGVYDGQAHTIDTNALAEVTYAHATDLTLSYALAKDGAYRSEPFAFRDAVATSFWYRISAPGYADYAHEAKVMVEPRDIANVTIAPIPDVTYADKPATPVPVVMDGAPSIMTAYDYTVSYLNNAKPGTATVVLTGKGNYTGTKSVTYVIKPPEPKYAALKGELAWKLNLGSGCYTAQLKLTCTNGLAQGISNLRFIYQDRMDGEKIASALYDSKARAYRPTIDYSGTTYRSVDLDATRIVSENVEVLYGVKDVSQAKGIIPSGECLIELYVKSLAYPVSDLGYIVWTSNGTQCMMPITASGGSQGMTVKNTLMAAQLAASVSMLSAPLSMKALNTSMALGVVIDPASSPYCKLTNFAVGDDEITGRVEVGRESSVGIRTQGALGTNARAILMGAKNLSDGFTEIGSVPVDARGAFRFSLGKKDYQFFRVRIDVQNVVE